MPLPAFLIPLALGAAKSIWSAQQRDPYSNVENLARQRAAELRKAAQQDIAGGMSADIRNRTANLVSRLRNRAAASGQGYSPALAAQEAVAGSQEAVDLAKARQYALQRREGLRDQATNLSIGAEQQAGQFREARKQGIVAPLIEGGLGAAALGLLPKTNNTMEQYPNSGGMDPYEQAQMMQKLYGGTEPLSFEEFMGIYGGYGGRR